MMLGTADVFMLSRISDETAGAVGLANEIIIFCIVMFGFVGIGTSVAVSQYLGAGHRKTASRISALAITLNLIFGVIVSVLLFGLGGQWMNGVNVSPAQADIVRTYLQLIGGFIWLEALSYAISSIIRANGHTRDVMLVTLGVNVLHVALNLLLIFGYLGFPQWGVTGAAVSAVVSRAVGVGVLFFLLYRRIAHPFRLRDYISFDKLHLKQILEVGLPAAGEHLAWQSQLMMVLSFINLIGQQALNAHIYVYNISAYYMALPMAIGLGTEIIVGHMVGAGEMQLAYRRLIRSLRIGVAMTFVLVGTAALFRHQLLGLFTDNAEIIAIGSSILLLSMILEPGRVFNLIVINSLRAAGDARFPVLMGVFSMWGVCVPLAYWLGVHLHIGLLGVWIAFTVDEWVRGLFMLFRWRSRVWVKKALVPLPPVVAVEG
jgi:putative MATE family efflux protein